MKILILTNDFHHKNREGIEKILRYLGWEFKYGNEGDIPDYNVIFSPCRPVNIENYPDKYFIFGPHFSVFPDEKLLPLQKGNNYVFTCPSEWPLDMWKKYEISKDIKMKSLPFPVNTEKFIPIRPMSERTEIFLYTKRRDPLELAHVKHFLEKRNISYRIFDYVHRYSEEDYLRCLQNAKWGFILDAHESQGFALEEAMSCDVPLFVWNVKSFSQEYGSGYPDFPVTSVPYWDEKCGEKFTDISQLEESFEKFINNLESYNPRQYILDELSVPRCAQRFAEIAIFQN